MIKDAKLDGVKIITPPTIFEDFRGSYTEIYNQRIYESEGIDQKFIQDDISTSYKHVLRGIHGDKKTWKLVTCLFGAFYLIVVNNDPNSKQFEQWESFTLSDKNRLQILIPPWFGNGHVVLTDVAIFHYKQTTEYERDSQFTITWDDPKFGFWWPVKTPIISMRDQYGD